MKYQAPYGSSDPNASYVNGNPSTGVEGSIPPAAMMEEPQRELVNAMLLAGLASSDADLTQVAQAMSIGIFLGILGGSANALTATLPGSVTIPVLQTGMVFHGIVSPSPNTAGVTLNLSGFASGSGLKPIVRSDGLSALAPGDLAAGALVSVRYDGSVFRYVGKTSSDISGLINQYNNTSGGYVPLFTARTYYIDASAGIDTNNGLTSGTPFRTFGAAYAAALRLNTNGNTVTFQFADATGPPHSPISATQPLFGGGMAVCQGNIGNSGNCIVSSIGGNAITATGGAVLYVQGFAPYTGSTANGCVVAQFAGQIHLIGPMLYVTTPGTHIQALDGGQVRLGANYTVSGGAIYHYLTTNGGQIYQYTTVQVGVTFTASMSFAYFASAVTDGRMSLPNMAFSIGSYTITATRYQVTTGGGILSAGSTTYFPGNIAGTVTSPGWCS